MITLSGAAWASPPGVTEKDGAFIAPDGKRCVSASGDATLRVWDLDSGECIRVLKGHTRSVKCVVIAPDGKRCVSASGDMTLRVWDI